MLTSKKVFVSILLFSFFVTGNLISQDTSSMKSRFKIINSIIKDSSSFDSNKEHKSFIANQNNPDTLTIKKDSSFSYFQNNIMLLKNDLLDFENTNAYSETVNVITRKLIFEEDNLYSLVLLKREIEEETKSNYSDFLKRKIILCLDDRIEQLSKIKFPYYTYRTKKAKFIKFVSVRTGNDLFTLAGISSTIGGFDIKKNRTLFQRNDDRDYTGSLLIEIGTDYFRLPRKKKLKTYQTLLYGFDVFTPYFKDTVLFSKNDTFNMNDRPHASFQYFGLSKKGLSRLNKYRWSTTFKFGKIGGYNGANFQAALHQDISYSPRPKGWDAQIANSGRLGISIEGIHEWMLFANKMNENKEGYFTNVHLFAIAEYKFGTYMTNGGGGFAISNKSFRENNHNFINKRNRNGKKTNLEYLMYNISFFGYGVKHNTMLQGYGILDTKENIDDNLTPVSKYKLFAKNVNPLIFSLNITLSYTTRYATFFYKWSSFSSEMRNMGDLGFKRYPDDASNMNIKNRWHHFAVLGATFNIID